MIGLIGINYKTSPIDIREKFSLNEQLIIEFGSYLKQRKDFSGLIVLSTCNRSEYYFQMQDCCEASAFKFMLRALKEFCNVQENVRQYFYFMSDELFALEGRPYVELCDLLKLLSWCASGGEAKAFIADGQVKVDGAVELRKRCKIRPGQTVVFAGRQVLVGE